MSGQRGQKPRPRAVAVCHGPWGSPRSDRGVYRSFCFPRWHPAAVVLGIWPWWLTFYSFFLFPLFLGKLQIAKIKAMKKKKEKELGLPPKKRSFKVKSLTIFLCAVGNGKIMSIIYVANHKIVLL